MDQMIQKIFQGIVDGQQDVVSAGVVAALETGVPARTILEEGMLPAMAELGTVRGDLHDMGKNLAKMMLEGAGFTVQDLGVDVTPEAFVAAADGVD